MKRSVTLLTTCLLSSFAVHSQTSITTEIAPWYNDQQAAVVLAFDDYSPGQKVIAIPQLMKRNMQATVFVVSDTAEWLGWDTVAEGSAAGIEMANHTVSHHDFVYDYTDWTGTTHPPVGPDRYDAEVAYASERIKAHTGKTPRTFAFPFGSYNRDIQNYLRDNGFVAARAWDPNKHIVMPYDFNTWQGQYYDEAYYDLRSTNAYMLQDLKEFKSVLDFAISTGGLYILTWHSLVGKDGGADWSEVVPQEVFEQQLDIVNAEKDDAWVTTFESAVKYHKQRAKASVTVLEHSPQQIVLSVTDTLDDTIYDHELTVSVKLPGNFGVAALTHKGEALPYRWDDQSIIFNVVPDSGEVIIKNWE